MNDRELLGFVIGKIEVQLQLAREGKAGSLPMLRVLCDSACKEKGSGNGETVFKWIIGENCFKTKINDQKLEIRAEQISRDFPALYDGLRKMRAPKRWMNASKKEKGRKWLNEQMVRVDKKLRVSRGRAL